MVCSKAVRAGGGALRANGLAFAAGAVWRMQQCFAADLPSWQATAIVDHIGKAVTDSFRTAGGLAP